MTEEKERAEAVISDEEAEKEWVSTTLELRISILISIQNFCFPPIVIRISSTSKTVLKLKRKIT